MASKISAQEQEWRGRDAANVLAEAEKIKKDPKLSKLARQYAGKMAKEHEQTANNLRSAIPTVKKSTPKATPKKTTTVKSSAKSVAKPSKKK